MWAYTVIVRLPQPEVRPDYLAWLRDEHVRDVLDAGALDAEILAHEDPTVVEIRYHFPSREAFDEYETTHAQRLRQHAFTKFEFASRCTFTRSIAKVIAHKSRGG
ncbi:MAG: DUF4286 family protein [Sandaracinaceae bacterium]|jgi:hypothetical protein|nr:DUF4286 family protein [Sandaracinaceae bacterium]